MSRSLPHHYDALGTADKIATLLEPEIVRQSLQGAAQWLRAAVAATGRPDKCCRDALYHNDGRITWFYPNSNTAELLSAWLDLAEIFNASEYLDQAIAYADGLLNDPVKGLLNDPAHPEARGIPWYWTDGGTYAGHYAMRMPIHFLRLYRKTGYNRYLDICDIIGRTLLARQLDSGLVSAAWDPNSGWMHEARVGSRYVCAAATFAVLWRLTGDDAYRRAWEKALAATLSMQNPDGSLFHCYDPRTAQPLHSYVKLHFTAYVLDMIEHAHAATSDGRLLECGRKIADHLASVFYYRHIVPYCVGNVTDPTDQMEAEKPVTDSAPGLFWLAQKTGVAVYRDIAKNLWFGSWLHQLPQDREPGWAGALMGGSPRPDVRETPAGVPTNRQYVHYDPTVIGRCGVWNITHHIFASQKLLKTVLATKQNPVSPILEEHV
ncbi:hypothetical protein OpiT1DRAFT_05062 [Opitutaceae bacterium TAV1]|nr:hypothetical protein OpiT1DRAFT_05062 [Opitutaceae bacterium TAV1]